MRFHLRQTIAMQGRYIERARIVAERDQPQKHRLYLEPNTPPLMPFAADLGRDIEHLRKHLYEPISGLRQLALFANFDRGGVDFPDLKSSAGRQRLHGSRTEKTDVAPVLAKIEEIPALLKHAASPAVGVTGADHQYATWTQDPITRPQQTDRIIDMLDHLEQRHCIEGMSRKMKCFENPPWILRPRLRPKAAGFVAGSTPSASTPIPSAIDRNAPLEQPTSSSRIWRQPFMTKRAIVRTALFLRFSRRFRSLTEGQVPLSTSQS